MKKRPKKPRCCYLCDWTNASTQNPRKWIMCMVCYHHFSVNILNNSFKDDCLRLYEYVYAAGKNRKDANQDRAERFLAFLMTTRNPPTESRIEAIHQDVHNFQEIKTDEPKRRMLQPRPRERCPKRILSRARLTRKFRNQEINA